MVSRGLQKLLFLGFNWGVWVAGIESGTSYTSFPMVVWYEVLGWISDGVLVKESSHARVVSRSVGSQVGILSYPPLRHPQGDARHRPIDPIRPTDPEPTD